MTPEIYKLMQMKKYHIFRFKPMIILK